MSEHLVGSQPLGSTSAPPGVAQVRAEGGHPLLEITTQFVGEEHLRRPIQREWRLRLYRDASEAGGSFRKAPRLGERSYRGVRGGAQDPERSAAVAARRAGTKLRRYVVANRLNRLGTLTYAEACTDERQVRKDVGEFFRRLKTEYQKPFPYLWIPEWHKDGYKLHLHFVVGKYVPRSSIVEAWGRGFVHIKLLGQVPIGQGSLGESRHAAAYLAKYLRKGLEADREFNLRRFDAARGFAPKSELIVGRSADEVTLEASERMGASPNYVWRSRDQDGWIGPSALWMSWDR